MGGRIGEMNCAAYNKFNLIRKKNSSIIVIHLAPCCFVDDDVNSTLLQTKGKVKTKRCESMI